MPSPADVLGRGIGLKDNFDAGERAGSIPLVSGSNILERDTAFSLVRELDVYRGELPDEDFAAEVELATRRVLNRDERIVSIGAISVNLDAGPRTAVINLSVTATEAETEELIVEI